MRFCAAAALLQRVQYAALHAVYPAAGSAEQIRITGGNDGLAVLHSAEQVRLPRFIQLGKHVVQQHHRMLARDFLRARSLGQLQAEHSAALLPLAGENLCRPAVDGNGKILPVRSRRTEACRDVPRPAFPQHGARPFSGSKDGSY